MGQVQRGGILNSWEGRGGAANMLGMHLITGSRFCEFCFDVPCKLDQHRSLKAFRDSRPSPAAWLP